MTSHISSFLQKKPTSAIYYFDLKIDQDLKYLL